MKPTKPTISSKLPVFVDLDGTIITNSILSELLVGVLRTHPLAIVMTPYWLLFGVSHLIRKLQEHTKLDPRRLRYDKALLSHLQELLRQGHPLYLTTGAPQREAEEVAEFLGIFSKVIATTDFRSVVIGHNKLWAIRRMTQGNPFIYIGNSYSDLAIWRYSSKALVTKPVIGLRLILRFIFTHRPEHVKLV